MWSFFLIAAVIVLMLTAYFAIFGKFIADIFRKVLTPSKILLIGIFISGTLLYIPPYYEALTEVPYNKIITLIISVLSSVEMFGISREYDLFYEGLADFGTIFKNAYLSLVIFLYAAAPVTTLTFALSLFKNFAAKSSYIRHFNNNIYAFSALNEKSLQLAKSLYANDSKAVIVFTDTIDAPCELIAGTKDIGALCFDDDILSVNFMHHSKRKGMSFFLISDNESENTRIAIQLKNKYVGKLKASIYVFSSNIESEIQLSAASENGIFVRRICDYEAMISQNLIDNGDKIFKSAISYGDEKLISAAIIGFDRYAKAMLKALVWYCQMDGYRLVIDVFPEKAEALAEFKEECSELMSDKHNGNFTDKGEAQYQINFHNNYNNLTAELSKISYAFISLQDDEKTLSMAVKVRQLSERNNVKPFIQAVIASTERKNALKLARNFKNQSYDIDFIGNIESIYSANTILGTKIVLEGLARHKKWGTEESFWKYEYNSKSSVASAIHKYAKLTCKIPGADKPAGERSPDEKYNIRRLEHRRWNAYMRSEGYTYSEKRNDLAKTHNCLIPFDKLPLSEQEKDDE